MIVCLRRCGYFNSRREELPAIWASALSKYQCTMKLDLQSVYHLYLDCVPQYYYMFREHPLMMSEFRGREEIHEIRTLVIEGSVNKIRTRGREGVKENPKIRTSFMDVPSHNT